MSENKHTPGPWKYDGVTPIVLDPQGRIVASVSTRDPLFPDALPAAANARLVAAAPDMLTALRAARDTIEGWRVSDSDRLGFDYYEQVEALFPSGDPMLVGIDAAIAKATGGGA